jgi:hypothetical protein
VVAIGPLRLLRLFTAFVVIGAMVIYLVALRPDLARPADLTTDTSNYFAAGQRLAEGNDLYSLEAGDRPAPADNAPYWSVPLLAPPPIAVAWAGLGLGPPAFMMQLWWLVGVALTAGLALFLAATLPAGGLIALCLLAYPMAEMAWSGNVTAYVIPATAAIWWLTAGARGGRSDGIAGILVGLLALVRLTPLVLVWWFVLRGRPRAIVATVATVAIGIVVSTVVAGPGVWVEFLGLAQGDALPTGLSLGGQLRAAFGDGPLVSLAPAIVGALGVVAATVLRGRPRLAFALLVATSIVATPALRWGSLGMLVAALAAWAPTAPWDVARAAPRARLSAAAGVALVVTLAVVLAAQVPRTAVAISNDSSRDVTVRFQMVVGTASFGYALPAGAEGRAWWAEPGSMPAIVRVFDVDCALLFEARTTVGSDAVLVTEAGTTIGPLPPGTTAEPPPALLGYSDACVGAVEPTTP